MNQTKQKKTGICVYGASSSQINPLYLEEGKKLGEGIAQNSWRLIYGAGDTGMMGAVARGVKSKGGEIIGVAPFFFDHPGILYEEHDDLIFTRTMRERKAFMESLADAFVVTPGGIGTLEEFMEIMTLKQLKQLDAPLIVLNVGGFYDPFLGFLEKMKEESFLSQSTLNLIEICSTAREALAWLEKQLKH